MGQAGKAALYGLGYGVGSGLVDASPLFAKHFPMNHTIKYLSRSIAGELLGSSLTGDFSSMTYGLNPGLAIPVLSDIASLTSPYWTSRIAQRKLNESIRNANEGDVGITSDIKIRSTLDYGSYTEDSGYWIARSNDGNYWYNEVGASLRLEVLSGGFSIDKIGQIIPQGLSFPNLTGIKIDIPIMRFPLNYMSAIHFSLAYSLSHRNW